MASSANMAIFSLDGSQDTPDRPSSGTTTNSDGGIVSGGGNGIGGGGPGFRSEGSDRGENQPHQKYGRQAKRTHPHKYCLLCDISETPEWRLGPDGPRTLCNACGLQYLNLRRQQQQILQGQEPEQIQLQIPILSQFSQHSLPPAEPHQRYRKRAKRTHPIGRCLSCDTSDTPEWRRGPDGARTLCNVCGLHYAKLLKRQQQQILQVQEPEQVQLQIPIFTQFSQRALPQARGSTGSSSGSGSGAGAGARVTQNSNNKGKGKDEDSDEDLEVTVGSNGGTSSNNNNAGVMAIDPAPINQDDHFGSSSSFSSYPRQHSQPSSSTNTGSSSSSSSSSTTFQQQHEQALQYQQHHQHQPKTQPMPVDAVVVPPQEKDEG